MLYTAWVMDMGGNFVILYYWYYLFIANFRALKGYNRMLVLHGHGRGYQYRQYYCVKRKALCSTDTAPYS
jgi:hypothetical protein